ncbi:MAG: radical SAM protein, partial [Candidatus Hodarchaeales archaeon]
HCKFCQVPALYSKVRYRSLAAIDKIFKHYAEVFKHQRRLDIRFITPNFLAYGSRSPTKPDMDKLWKLVELGKKYNARLFMGTFPSEIRPEIVNEETIEVLKESRSRNVAIGCQSGSLRVLKLMRRGHGTEEVERACDLLVKNRFMPHVDFILGSPGEKQVDMLQSLDMMKDLVKKGCKIRVHHFLPLPGTAWANMKPSIVPKEISVEIGKLARDKAATGCFERQKAGAGKQ